MGVAENFPKGSNFRLVLKMGIEKIAVENGPGFPGGGRAWGLWHIDETEAVLAGMLGNIEAIPETLVHPQKRQEWFAGRLLVKNLVEAQGMAFQGLIKDAYGKPFLRGHAHQVSLSHSYPYVAALIDAYDWAGIDLEQPKDKLLRVAARIHHTDEQRDLGTDLVKHCIYWCAKEALIKVYGKKDLVLAENLKISPFTRQTEGDIIGKIIARNEERIIPLHYIVFTNFVVVYTKRTDL